MGRETTITTGVIVGVIAGLSMLLLGVGAGNDLSQLIGGGIALLSVGVLAAFISRL